MEVNDCEKYFEIADSNNIFIVEKIIDPTNITTIKYFEEVKEQDFLHYGSCHKNLYLLLLEDL